MVFLSLWHGLHIGYLINFSFEVPAVLAEKKVCGEGEVLTVGWSVSVWGLGWRFYVSAITCENDI